MKTTIQAAKLVLIALVFSGSSFAAEGPATVDPVETLVAYCAALKKGDIDGADGLTARSAKLPEAHITQYNTLFSKKADSAFRFSVHKDEFEEKGGFAAVLCDVGPEGSSECMRAILVRQDGTWRVRLKFWVKESAWYPVEGKERDELAEIEKWASKQIEKKAKP